MSTRPINWRHIIRYSFRNIDSHRILPKNDIFLRVQSFTILIFFAYFWDGHKKKFTHRMLTSIKHKTPTFQSLMKLVAAVCVYICSFADIVWWTWNCTEKKANSANRNESTEEEKISLSIYFCGDSDPSSRDIGWEETTISINYQSQIILCIAMKSKRPNTINWLRAFQSHWAIKSTRHRN